MKKYLLGNTGIEVSPLCFGALPMGPLQANLSVEDGGTLIVKALECGVNFIDTAELYGTYSHIKWALERYKGDVIIASKSMSADYDGMKKSVEKALADMDRSRIDIFHLHAARDNDPINNRLGALEALIEMKNKDKIKAVGVSCHSVKGINIAARDPRIDVVFPLINKTGLGILDGDVSEMREAIAAALSNGKGVYAMKALGGGNLLSDIVRNIEFVQNEACLPVIAVGMVRPVEVDINLKIFSGESVPDELLKLSKAESKKTTVLFMCKGCGKCLEVCHSGAISIVEGKAVIDNSKCLLCGYCSEVCPQFAIRVV